MRYALLIYNEHSDRAPTAADENVMLQEYGKYTQDLIAGNAMAGGDRLGDLTSATTVRVRDGKRVVTDGPFAETKEWLGGFYIVEAASLDQALEAASKCPGAKYGSVEVRPIVDTGS